MFKQLFSTVLLAAAILAQGVSAAPQTTTSIITPPPGIGAICGTYLGVVHPACQGSLVCCQVEVTPAMNICLTGCPP
ncbi:hypothetical protein C8R45DRAFT_1222259 [Mycena sanguinolenta]|nr:hypothetical protein C8R45DRAFT_1222259 [Mycena sanguinolenta]